MGGLSSPLTGMATSVLGGFTGGTLSNGLAIAGQIIDNKAKSQELRAQQNIVLQQLEQKQGQELSEAQSEAALDRENIQLQAAQNEAERQAALKRAVARQRAASGASGVGSAGGSGEAILLGLFEESEDEKNERERLDDLRLRAIDQDMENVQSQNLLETSQLRQRQKLERSLFG